jgi:hypothetical protein
MSFMRTITTYDNNNLVKHKAQMINDRQRQSRAWLRRQEEQKKPGAPHRLIASVVTLGKAAHARGA